MLARFLVLGLAASASALSMSPMMKSLSSQLKAAQKAAKSAVTPIEMINAQEVRTKTLVRNTAHPTPPSPRTLNCTAIFTPVQTHFPAGRRCAL